MELHSTLASAFTVLSFLVFICIVCWAWSGRRRAAFAAAAAEPFALPEDGPLAAMAISQPSAGENR